MHLPAWPEWNGLVPRAAGVVSVGQRLEFGIRRDDGRGLRDHRPVVVELEAPRRVALAASFGHRALVHLVHAFVFEDVDGGPVLRQTWTATGILVPVVWGPLTATMARFSELGEDLRRRIDGGS